MKRLICVFLTVAFGVQAAVAASAQDYVRAVEKINDQYKKDTRDFFNTLDPMQRGFNAQQQQRFCAIVTKYADDLYAAADQNRTVIDRQYAGITKEDVKKQVLDAREMQMLKPYNVQCDWK
ncbi:hypothetical protein [Acinetobacter tianfuensis]|uniref:Uncharacterized protein n=1 Tax=Acinetobacter tianfuensis TaxID=2419603 RepID=A0A3A8EF36_9GAMM|nr:hypothetical protein [Acinetobacter tianfuensis]RKG29460.1 hypothetical protein D7V32_15020 [Acinetobacter tianfuensis]